MTAVREVFDAHVHIIDPRFPLVANQGFVPDAYTAADYRQAMAPFRVVGGAVVAGSFQGNRTEWLAAALAELGPHWYGVAQLDAATPDAELADLDAAGVRALRINLHRGESKVARDQFALARRAARSVGWHCELYVDCGALGEHAERIAALPRVVIDHLGLTARGLAPLLALVAGGAKVKATGFGRLDFDVLPVLRRIAAIDPTALLFGSDLPGTRAPRAFERRDVDVIIEALGEEIARRVLVDNGRALYARRPR